MTLFANPDEMEGIDQFQELTEGFDMEQALQPLSENMAELASVELKATLPELDARAVKEGIDAGFITDYRAEAQIRGLTDEASQLQVSISDRLLLGAEVDESLLKDPAKLQEYMKNNPHPEVAAYFRHKTSKGETFMASEKLKFGRLYQIRKKFADSRAESSGGFWAGMGYFLDMALSDVISGGAFSRSNFVDRLDKLISDPTISQEEFNKQADAIVKEANDMGLFTENNWFFNDAMMARFMTNQTDALDYVFTLLDAGFLTRSLSGVGRMGKLLHLRTPSEIASATVPHADAADIVKTKVLNGGDEDVLKATSPASIRPGDPNKLTYYTAPGHTALIDVELSSAALDIFKRKDFGWYLSPDEWAAAQPKLVADVLNRIKETSSRKVIDYGVTQGPLGNPLGVAVFGNVRGRFWDQSFRAHAEAFAEKINGIVLEVQQAGKTQLYVRKEFNLSKDGILKDLNVDELNTSILSTLKLASPQITSSSRLGAILKRGEAQRSHVLHEQMKAFKKTKSRTHKDVRLFVDDMYENLRDGIESYKRNPVTLADFETKFFSKFSRTPTAAEKQYFTEVTDLLDTAYYLTADVVFKQAVEKGYRVLRHADPDGVKSDIMLKPFRGQVPEGGIVVKNIDDGSEFTIKPGAVTDDIFVPNLDGLAEFAGKKYRYIKTNQSAWRRIYHTDVLPYNVGGPRVTDSHRHFVKLPSFFNEAGKGRTAGRQRTLVGSFTEKEARVARDQIENLFTAIRGILPTNATGANTSNSAVVTAIRAQKGNTAFEQAIARNTTWNMNITSVDDLADYVAKNKTEVFETPVYQSRNRTPEVEAAFNPKTGLLEDDFIYSSSFGARGDDPVLTFGGLPTESMAFSKVAERNYTNALTRTSEAPYIRNATEGWWNGGRKHVSNEKELQLLSPTEKLRRAKVNTSTKAGRAYETERQVILRRIDLEDAFTRAWRERVGFLAEKIWDKGYKRSANILQDQFSTNPLHAMRALAFHLKLGMFNPAQLVVQSAQMVNIAAVGGVHGAKGVSAALPLRLAMHNGTKQVSKHIGKVSSALTGLKPHQFDELVEFYQGTGRHIIGHEVAERDTKFFIANNTLSKLGEMGRFFFNEGEGLARSAAAATAYFEFRAKFGAKASIKTPQAALWMTERMDVLTASMTTASRAPWQANSIAAVPTQFMSYTMRMIEQLFSNRILTPAEKGRLIGAWSLMWGTTGIGLGWALDDLIENAGWNLDDQEYTALRYGLLDAAIEAFTGSRTAWSTRLGAPEGLYDMWEKLTQDETFLEFFAGPSGSIVPVFADLYKGMADMANGRYELMTYDFSRIPKQLTSINQTTRAYHAWKTGEYFSKNGALVAEGLSKNEAIFHFFGAPLQDVQAAFDIQKDKKKRETALRDIGFQIKTLGEDYIRLVTNGELDKAVDLQKDINALLAPYSMFEKSIILKVARPTMESMLDSVVRRDITTFGPDRAPVLNAKTKDE